MDIYGYLWTFDIWVSEHGGLSPQFLAMSIGHTHMLGSVRTQAFGNTSFDKGQK